MILFKLDEVHAYRCTKTTSDNPFIPKMPCKSKHLCTIEQKEMLFNKVSYYIFRWNLIYYGWFPITSFQAPILQCQCSRPWVCKICCSFSATFVCWHWSVHSKFFSLMQTMKEGKETDISCKQRRACVTTTFKWRINDHHHHPATMALLHIVYCTGDAYPA